ncbi:MAG: ABC transporter permease [Bacteroidaceae bacterium]|nr:ABC transporter permease [Bacteroidaceae bacterium]
MNSYLTFLSRNKLYTTIQAFGLAVSLGFVILLASYAHTEFTVAGDQPLYHDLYVLGSGDYSGMTLGTAEEFFPSVPEIKRWTRCVWFNEKHVVTVGEDFYETQIAVLDTNFLSFFNYEVEGCTRERILATEGEVILSRSFARKAFGNENPVGRTILFDKRQKTVAGIIEDFTAKDIFKPADIFLNMKYAGEQMPMMDNFGSSSTFLTLADGGEGDAVAEKLLDKYVDYWQFYSRTSEGSAFLWGSTLTPLDEFYFSPIVSNQLRKGDRGAVGQLLIVALILLLSAIFNYINLTVAQTGRRAREMAMRKILGESQTGITCRYFCESTFFTLCCIAAGWAISLLLRPLFEEMLDREILLSPVAAPWMLAYGIAAVLLIGAVCCIMPSVLIAGFTPMDVVKGEFRLRSKMTLSRVFIVLQNVISTCLVAIALTMMWQISYLVKLPTGYNTKDLVTLYTDPFGYTLERQAILRSRLLSLPEVEEVGLAGGTPLLCGMNGVRNKDEQHPSSYLWLCRLDSTAFRLLGIEPIEQWGEALEGKVWVTPEGRDYYGLSARKTNIGDTPPGGQPYEACGVVRDYRAGNALRGLDEKTFKAIMMCGENTYYYNMVIKTRGDHQAALKAIRQTYTDVLRELTGLPREPELQYMDDALYGALKPKMNILRMALAFTIVSLLISALGMLAMSVYYAEQQRRSIAVCRVMGASIGQALWQLVHRFLTLSLVAIALAIPVSVWLMRRYLEGFPHRINFPWTVLLLASLFSLLIAILSITAHSLRVALANPVKSIHTE